MITQKHLPRRTFLRGVGAKDDLAPLPLKIVDPEGSVRPERAERQAPAEAPADQVAEEAAPAAAEAPEASEAAAVPEEHADEHQELHERTKREMEELADLEL